MKIWIKKISCLALVAVATMGLVTYSPTFEAETPDPMIGVAQALVGDLKDAEGDIEPYPAEWPVPENAAFKACMSEPFVPSGNFIYTAWDPNFHTDPNKYYDQDTGNFFEEAVKAELNDTFGRAVVYNKMDWTWDGICLIHKWEVGAPNVDGAVAIPQQLWKCYMETTPFFQTFTNGSVGFNRNDVLAYSACGSENAPTITAISPNQGLLAGGYPLTITGTKFGSTPSVTVGGNDCPVVSSTETQIICTVPAGAQAGNTTVVVSSGSYSSVPFPFRYIDSIDDVPTITSIAPNSGPLAGGNPVTITGTNFGDVPTVTVGGKSCAVTSSTPTSIVCTIPEGSAPGPVNVIVKNGAVSSAPMPYTYLDNGGPTAPTITNITPTESVITGGVIITITGTGFENSSTVAVGGKPCTGVTRNGMGQLTCTVPAGNAVGPTSVVVTTGGLSSAPFPFTYTPVCTAGETRVCFIANGTGQETCALDGSAWGACTLVSCDGGYIALGNTCVLDPTPTISNLTPTSGPEAGNTLITITGTNFVANSKVYLGANECKNVNIISGGTTILCNTPAGTGVVPVKVVTPTGKESGEAMNFTYIPNTNGAGDYDGDGRADSVDNCPDTPNRVQTDTDGDGIGDRCDADDDSDGVLDRKYAESLKNVNGDNCQHLYNPDQADTDGDYWGNACDDLPGIANSGNGHYYSDITYQHCQYGWTSGGVGLATTNDPYCYDYGDGIKADRSQYDKCVPAGDMASLPDTEICYKEYDMCTGSGVLNCYFDLYFPTDAEYLVNNFG